MPNVWASCNTAADTAPDRRNEAGTPNKKGRPSAGALSQLDLKITTTSGDDDDGASPSGNRDSGGDDASRPARPLRWPGHTTASGQEPDQPLSPMPASDPRSALSLIHI